MPLRCDESFDGPGGVALPGPIRSSLHISKRQRRDSACAFHGGALLRASIPPITGGTRREIDSKQSVHLLQKPCGEFRHCALPRRESTKHAAQTLLISLQSIYLEQMRPCRLKVS